MDTFIDRSRVNLRGTDKLPGPTRLAIISGSFFIKDDGSLVVRLGTEVRKFGPDEWEVVEHHDD